MKQQSFWKHPGAAHGGDKSKGKRKTARPLATKRSMHACFKSDRASHDWSFVKYRKEIESTLRKTAKRFGIRIYARQVMSNHVHILLQGKRREDIQNFLRLFPGKVAMLVTNTANTRPIERFWEGLVFTRIVEWGRDFWGMLNYIEKNRLESEGVPRDIVDMWFEDAFS